MIHRRMFVWIDACLIVAIFILAHVMMPYVRPARDMFVGLVQSVAPSATVYFSPGIPDSAPLSQRLWILVVIVPAVLLTLLTVDAYGHERDISRKRMLLAGPFAALIGMSVAALMIFLLRIHEWSRLFLFTFTTLIAAALTSGRVFIRTYYRVQTKAGRYRRNILIVGPEETVPSAVAFVRSHWSEDHAIVIGHLESSPYDSGGDRASNGPSLQTVAVQTFGGVAVPSPAARVVADSVGILDLTELMPPCLGRVSDIEDVLLGHPVHEVVAVLSDDSVSWVSEVMRACDYAGLRLRLAPEVLLSYCLANLVVHDGGRKVPSILLAPRVWDAEKLQIKRLIDIVVSVAALVVLAPVLAVIAVLVGLSSRGPILYRYQMVGQNGRHFVGWKFRTMVTNANALKPALLARNEMTGPVFKMKDDPRVTRIGRWLRKFSLDELPQLYSVVKGDLSLVGPRAAGSDEFGRYEFWQMRKISVRPGITCLWQVRGRNVISNFDDWVRMDLEYIDNWSLWLDFKILVRTFFVVITGTGW